MVHIRRASESDHGAIFTLQRAAFLDEARLYETPFVPSLDETLEQFAERMQQSVSWVSLIDNRLVGAVSLRDYHRDEGPMGPDIERVMVAPDCRGLGLSRALMETAEAFARSKGHEMVRLIVGDLAKDNIAIYTHLGWERKASHRLDGFEHVLLHTMAKRLN